MTMRKFKRVTVRDRSTGSASLLVVGAVVAGLSAAPVQAQAYPTRPIEIVVPFVAGGTSDIIARMIGQRFTDSWSATVVVNNRPGGGSMIGSAAVAKSPPDGHTLLVTTIALAINAGMQKLTFDPATDLVPVSELTSIPLILVLHPSVPATNLRELVTLIKANPGKWDYATSGAGTSPHLATEMFKSLAGIDMVHVPFKGNAEAMNAFLGGHVKIYFAQVPAVLQHVKSGAVRAIAVSTDKRLPYLPDVPTVAELGYPGYEITSWQGMFAPAGTPKDFVDKIAGETIRMLKTPEISERIAREGSDPIGSTPEEFSRRYKSEIAKWAKVTKEAGMQGAN
jgi:tripartite-type tricarboxylate transporter receptor subunit TctC